MIRKHLILFISFFACLCICHDAAFALAWNDTNVTPIYKDGYFRDKKTNRFISIKGMPQKTKNQLMGITSTTTKGKAKPSTFFSKAKFKHLGKAMGVATGISMVAGTVFSDEEPGWGDVISGGIGGGITGLTVGGVWGAVGGTILGAGLGGAKFWSKDYGNDCIKDRVTDLTTCCNTAFYQGGRNVDIGGYMFCAHEQENSEQYNIMAPYVRQCLQGGKPQKSDALHGGLFDDDSWSEKCVVRYCEGVEPPPRGDEDLIEYIADTEHICYHWEYIDEEANADDDEYVDDPELSETDNNILRDLHNMEIAIYKKIHELQRYCNVQ